MIFRQLLHYEPVAASYLFGCAGHAACAVVDPVGDPEEYVRLAAQTALNERAGVAPPPPGADRRGVSAKEIQEKTQPTLKVDQELKEIATA